MSNKQELTKRYLQAIDTLLQSGLANNDFEVATTAKMSTMALTHLRNGRNNVSRQTIGKTIDAFPQINRDYIEKGEKPILKTFLNIIQPGKENVLDENLGTSNNEIKRDTKGVQEYSTIAWPKFRYLTIKAQAGELTSLLTRITESDLELEPVDTSIVPTDKHLLIEIEGDSMAPVIESGDRVIVRSIDLERETDLILYYGFVIIMKPGHDNMEGAVLCKVLKSYNRETKEVEFVSINPGYPNYKFNLSEVALLYYIKEVVPKHRTIKKLNQYLSA